MMRPVERVDGRGASAIHGRVELDGRKTLWIGTMLLGSLFAPLTATPGSVALFAALTYATLLVGHSVGMHRLVIHRAFKTSRGLRRALALLGTLVGMGGPACVIRIHDLRDWAQRLPDDPNGTPACHDFFSHRRGFARDLLWQLFCRFAFARPPRVSLEPEVADDAFMRALDTYAWALQLLLAAALFALGGWGWVVWGVCLRVVVSTVGHWAVTYLCHNPGPARWHVRGAGVQASDLARRGLAGHLLGLLTHGECWHSHHHAFPESARIGLDPGQTDPAWWVIRGLERAGLAWDVGVPRALELREDLVPGHSPPHKESRTQGPALERFRA